MGDPVSTRKQMNRKFLNRSNAAGANHLLVHEVAIGYLRGGAPAL